MQEQTLIKNALKYYETGTRFELADDQEIQGASNVGFTEEFPLTGKWRFRQALLFLLSLLL